MASRVYTALHIRRTIFGVDHRLAGLVIGVTGFMAFTLAQVGWQYALMALGFGALLLFVLRQLSKRDASILEVYLAYQRHPWRYVPHLEGRQKRGFRPQGFGRFETYK